MSEYKYPFTYKLRKEVFVNIEHIDDYITCIWFSNNNKEEQNIPDGFKLYAVKQVKSKPENNQYKEHKEIRPYRNTQTFAIPKTTECIIKFNDMPFFHLTTIMLLTSPPIVKHAIHAL